METRKLPVVPAFGTALDFQSPIFGFEVFREKEKLHTIGSWAELFTLEFVEAPEMPYGGT